MKDRLSLSLPAEMVAWIRAQAKTDSTTVSAVVEKAIRSYKAAVDDALGRSRR